VLHRDAETPKKDEGKEEKKNCDIQIQLTGKIQNTE
jgi:hypothetical protein